VIGRYAVGVVVETDSPAITEARCDPGETVAAFLGKLARDAGLLLTCDTGGDLVVKKVTGKGSPIAAITQGESPCNAVSCAYNGAGRFTTYKLLQQQDGTADIEGIAVDGTISGYRPKVSTGAEGDAKNITSAAEWERALALAGSVSVTLSLVGWRGPAGALWQPGDLFTLKAPGAYILRETVMMIDSVNYQLSDSGRTCEINAVLPATYTGQMPEVVPWV
jgi:prophage tail gpP-like protein